jgi:TetR/AcrR family transcriptional regulator
MNSSEKYLPADERRAVIIDVVIRLAAERNPHGITTTAIAERMGLTQGALFRHFPNKAALLAAVMTWTADTLLSRLDEVMRDLSSPLAALRAMFLAHADFVAEHPGVPRLLFGELQQIENTPSKEVVKRLLGQYREQLHRLIEAGKALGEIDDTLDTAAAATLFTGTLQGLVVQSLVSGDGQQIRGDAARVFALYQRAIGTRS